MPINRNKLKAFLLPLSFLLVGILVTTVMILHHAPPEEKKTEFPPLAVEVATVSQDTQKWSANFQGEVRAKTNIDLIAQVTGKVVEVSDVFIEGGEFEAGQPLVRIDDSDYQVAYRTAQATVAEAQVQLDIELAAAATNEKEWKDLQGKSIEEANPLVLNKPQVERARARLSAAMAELASARLNLERTSISAPFSGRVQTKMAELGQFVARGNSIGRVFATDAMEIRIPMSDFQMSELGLSVGQMNPNKADFPVIVTANFGIHKHQWSGYLKGIDANVDQQTRLLYATVVVDDPFQITELATIPLAPGLFVDVELTSSSELVGLQVPRNALRNGNEVYVVDDGKLRVRQVRTVFTTDAVAVLEDASITELDAGEKVIVSAVPGAFDGMSVLVAGEEVREEQVKSSVEEPVNSI